MSGPNSDPVGAARKAAIEVAALAPESDNPAVMASSLQLMVGAGAFGIWQRTADGTPLVTPAEAFEVLETYSAADLAAAFVLSQHPMFVETAFSGGDSRLLDTLTRPIRGECSTAVAFSDLRHGRSPEVRRAGDVLVVTGSVNRVSGLAWADWLLLGVLDRSGAEDEVVFAFVELTEATRRRITVGPRQQAAGLTASDTRTAAFEGLEIPLGHLVNRQPHRQWLHLDHERIVNSKPFVHGYARRLLDLIRAAGADDQADSLAAELAANRSAALRLQREAGLTRTPERLWLRLEGSGILHRIARAYAAAHRRDPGALPWDPAEVNRTVKVLLFPASNRYIQQETARYLAGKRAGPADLPRFAPA